MIMENKIKVMLIIQLLKSQILQLIDEARSNLELPQNSNFDGVYMEQLLLSFRPFWGLQIRKDRYFNSFNKIDY